MTPTPPLRRILIVKLSSMGDVLHALPAAFLLREAAPGAEIHWAVDRRFAELVDGNPAVDRAIPLDIRAWKGTLSSPATWKAVLAGARELRSGGYDAAFDLQGNVKSGVVTFLSGAPLRFGFAREGVREAGNLLFTNRKVVVPESERNAVRRVLRVAAAPFGGSVPDRCPAEMPVPEARLLEAGRLLERLLPGAFPRVALHPGTTWNSKRMDARFWAETVAALAEAFPGVGVFLSWGGEAERREAEAVRERVGSRAALLPAMGFRELAAAYRACGYLLAPDTGPLHLAAAAGAATVSVYRGTDPERTAPLGSRHRVVRTPLPCAACYIRGARTCPRDEECRRSVSPAGTAAAVASLVREEPAEPGLS